VAWKKINSKLNKREERYIKVLIDSRKNSKTGGKRDGDLGIFYLKKSRRKNWEGTTSGSGEEDGGKKRGVYRRERIRGRGGAAAVFKIRGKNSLTGVGTGYI